jgi:hypothetical protein
MSSLLDWIAKGKVEIEVFPSSSFAADIPSIAPSLSLNQIWIPQSRR